MPRNVLSLNARNRSGMKEVSARLDKLLMPRKNSKDKNNVHEDNGYLVSERFYSYEIDITAEEDQSFHSLSIFKDAMSLLILFKIPQ